MNQKKSKLIRRIVRVTGCVKADFPLHHYDHAGRLCHAGAFLAMFGGVLTARYHDKSFQRVHRMAKRTLRGMGMASLRMLSKANFVSTEA